MGVRNALTLVGAVIGGIVTGGNPAGIQAGAAIGGFVGGIIDPQVFRTPSIGDVALQKVGEGVPIPLYDGKAGGAGILVYCSEPDVVTVETEQGKATSVVESDRVYITFAILIGQALRDGPGQRTGIPNLLRIWQDEKLLYDVTPESEILAESGEFAETFTFYPGTLTQNPDPDLEAIEGAGNVPAYPGRAYIVFKNFDATALQGSPPRYRFEVATDAEAPVITGRWWMTGTNTGASGKVWINDQLADWSGAQELTRSPAAVPTDHGVGGGGYYRLSNSTAILINSDGQVERVDGLDISNPVSTTVTTPLPAGLGRVRVLNGIIFVFSYNGASTYYSSTDAGATWNTRSAPALRCADIGRINSRWVMFCQQSSSRAYYYSDDPEEPTSWSLGSGPNTGSAGDMISMVGKAMQYVGGGRVVYTTDGVNWSLSGDIIPDDIGLGCHAYDGGFNVICGDTNSSHLYISNDRGDTWTSVPFGNCRRIDWFDGVWLFNTGQALGLWYSEDNGETISQVQNLPTTPTTSTNRVYASNIFTQSTVEAGTTTLARIIKALGRRCRMPDSVWNLPGLDQVTVRGFVVASQAYTAGDAMNGLRFTYPSDAACFDGQIHVFRRGGAVDLELDEQYLVDEDSDQEEEEILRNGDDRQTAPLRLPAKVNLMFPNATLGYQLTKATSPNFGQGGESVQELTIEVPVVLNEETEAPALADVLDKVTRTEAKGEMVRLFPDDKAGKLVPGSVVRLVDGMLSRRARAVSVRIGEGTRRLGLVLDRARDYTSQQTAPPSSPWPTPPPSLVGVTDMVLMNLPVLRDADDLLGVYAAISGEPGSAWYGARIQYRVQGTTTWNDLGTFTTRAIMGELVEAFPYAPAAYPDYANPLVVELKVADELETLSVVEWLSEMGAWAVVRADGTAEIVQPRVAVNDSGQTWTLTEHQRGRLATSTAAHLAGARAVKVSRAVFLPLPTSAIGQTLEFRAISSGGSPEDAVVHELVFDPLSQTEFAVAGLSLARAGGTIEGSWIELRRLGTEVIPIRSINWEGFLVTLTDGSVTQTFETTETSFSRSDAAFSGPITVTVQQLNRFTGPGPSTSEIA